MPRRRWLVAVLMLAAVPIARGVPEPGTCDAASFKVVIDVGHTVEAHGATSARGVPEFDFNLRLARQVDRQLHDAGFVRTSVLIMHGIGRPQLKQRSARANAFAADLFVSIHHDSVQDAYLGRWQHDGRTDLFSDRFSGYSIFISNDNALRAASIDFARLLADELIGRGMRYSAHHAEDIAGERRPLIDAERGIYRYDELLVLKDTRAPAVLLESGIIVNRAEETALASPQRQRAISAAIVAATQRFCALRQRR